MFGEPPCGCEGGCDNRSGRAMEVTEDGVTRRYGWCVRDLVWRLIPKERPGAAGRFDRFVLKEYDEIICRRIKARARFYESGIER